MEDEEIKHQFREIISELSEMRSDLKRFVERSNQDHLESAIAESRNSFCNAISRQAARDAQGGLERKMTRDCSMREACKSLFADLLQKNMDLARETEVPEEKLAECRSKLKEMKKRAPYEWCDACFSEASKLLDRQVDLISSLKVYRDNKSSAEEISEMPEEPAVKEILEPVSNKQRLQILKALCCQTMTFSEMSNLTGLRGGNLLFHLQKLSDCGMILQRHERGDYMITQKGYAVLKGIAALCSALDQDHLQTKEI
jgi:DNA-binding transcriptional ArsR family regulator